MKNLIKSVATGTAALVFGATLVFGLGSTAQAASCYQYNANGFPTSQTPVFNNICGVPGYGDESDFVRLRADQGGDMNMGGNAYTDPLSSDCADGSTFDIHTYIHNDAESQYNDNGSGPSVAHDVQLAMSAPLGKTQSQFVFGSTISASNAATVSDTGTLNCSGQAVQLSLVPNTVNIYGGSAYGWKSLPDSAVNGTTKLGNPTFGSGDEWGCWNYRMAVVYEVVVHVIPKPTPSTGICKEAAIEVNKNRNVTVSVTGATSNAKIVGYKIDFGDNTVVYQQSATHTYAQAGKYTITAYVEVQYANGSKQWIVPTSSACQGSVTITPNTPPTVTPPVTPPAVLPSTGPAGLVGLFAGTSGLGTIGHFLYRRRKFARQ